MLVVQLGLSILSINDDNDLFVQSFDFSPVLIGSIAFQEHLFQRYYTQSNFVKHVSRFFYIWFRHCFFQREQFHFPEVTNYFMFEISIENVDGFSKFIEYAQFDF